jgi:hypothetical protein
MEDAKSLLNQSNNLDSEVFCDKVHALASAAGWSEPVIIDRKRYSLQDRYGIAFQVLYLLLHKSRSYGAGDLKADEEKAVDKPTTAIVVTPENDYYALLGVSSNATQEEIEVAYKQKSSALQTDVLENKLRAQGLSRSEVKIRLEQAQKEYQDLLTAYDSVGNTKNREHYDNFRNKYGQDKDRRGGSSSQTRHKAKGTAHDYEVLGLTLRASEIEKMKAFREASKKIHPDIYEGQLGGDRKNYTPEQVKELNMRIEQFRELNTAFNNVFDKEQYSREVAERDAKTQAQSQENRKIIAIETAPKAPETETSIKELNKTEKYRKNVEQAGYLSVTPEQTADLKSAGVIPLTATSEETSAGLTTAVKLRTMGVKAEEFSQAIDTSKFLSFEEKQTLQGSVAFPMEAIEHDDPKQSNSLFIGNREPSVSIQQISTPSTTPQPNQLILQPQGDGFFKPLLDETTSLVKDSAEKVVSKTLKKGGGKAAEAAVETTAKTVAKKATTEATTKALKGSGSKLLTKIGSKIAAKAGITAAAQALGSTVPVIGNIIAFIATEVIPKLIGFIKKGISKILQFFTGKDDSKSQLKDLSGIAFVAFLATGAVVPAIISGGIFLTTLGAGSIMGGFAGAFTALVAVVTTIILAISTPIIISTLIFIFLVIFIIMIINNSAFVVPYGGFTPPQEATQSLYIGVTKTAIPSLFNNPPPSRTVEYTITITAKLTDITGVSPTYSCSALTPDGSIDCPANPQLEEALQAIPDTITPNEPYTFSYQATYDTPFVDSIITDTITIQANTDGGVDRERASANVVIGNPPTGCFTLSDASTPWSTREDLRANLQAAINHLVTNHPVYVARVCNSGEVPLCYGPTEVSPGYWGWHVHRSDCDILFSAGGLTNVQNAIYILTHEASHHIQAIDTTGLQARYNASPAYGELPLCTYTATTSPLEGFAEGNALYVQLPTFWPTRCGSQSFQEKYPQHYIFARDNVFSF